MPDNSPRYVLPATQMVYINPLFPETHKYPQYQSEKTRMESFQERDHPIVSSDVQKTIVQAGFFFIGVGDSVRCFSCGVGLKDWQPVDDPWIEHARWHPQCPYLRNIKGLEFIQRVLMEHPTPERNEGSGSSRNESHDMETSAQVRASVDSIDSPAARRVIQMGFTKSKVKMAIEMCDKQAHKGQGWNETMLVETLLDKLEDQGAALPEAPYLPEAPKSTEGKSVTGGEDDQMKRLLSRSMCIMCESNYSNVLFLPCAHLRMCADCAQNAFVCPMCGRNVQQKIKLHDD